jgi:outer membrane protein assembly factor BamB
LAQFARLHPDARGRMGGQEGKYTELLGALLVEEGKKGTGTFYRDGPANRPRFGTNLRSVPYPSAPGASQKTHLPPFSAPDADWPTFAGDFSRNKIAPPVVDVGAVAWRMALAETGKKGTGPISIEHPPGRSGRLDQSPFSPFHPLVVGNLVLVNDQQRILAVHLDSGKPAWGQALAIYQSQLAGIVAPPLLPETLGTPQFTMTAFQDKLFARMGSPVTGVPHATTTAAGRGYLACLDLAAEGRLLWKFEPEEGWALEGSPAADSRGVYVAMRRNDIRPQAFVACLDADTGRVRWRRFVCSAETPARGIYPESTHNLLTICGEKLYYNTNLGAVAALAAEDGRLLWVSLYPRARRGNLAKLAPHWRRELNPCLLDHGVLLVAPADSAGIFALDAANGQALWQTGSEVEDAADLLGVAGQWLIAGGGKLYWISLKDEDRGRVKHVWPDGAETPGWGRGVLAGDCVLWTTHENLYIFDQQTAQPRRVVDLIARDASGGNLLAADGRLLIATESELIAIGPYGGRAGEGGGIAY